MKCNLCGYEFDEKAANPVCTGCPMKITNSCNMARCPNCGFEMPREPQISRLLRKIKG